MRGMVIHMEEAKLKTLAQVKAFLDGTTEVAFRVPKDKRNPFIERVFKRFGYAPHGRLDKGVLLRYIERMTGLSRQKVTRLVAQYRKNGMPPKQTHRRTVRKILRHLGEPAQPPRISTARGPPLWEAATATEQAGNDPQWDSSTQPEPVFEFDQCIA